ncbi:MAG: energy transducer TonB [Bacteroidota bacterium]
MMKFFLIIPFCFFVVTTCSGQNKENHDAEFIGGYDSLFKALQSQSNMINTCERKGKVYLDFNVNELGETGDIQIARGLCPKADSIAFEVVKKLKYKPAVRNGQQIVVRKSLPIYFNTEL